MGLASPETTSDWITHNVHNIISDKLPTPAKHDPEDTPKSKKRRPRTAVKRLKGKHKRRPSSAVFAHHAQQGLHKRLVEYGPRNLQDRRCRSSYMNPKKGQAYARVRSFAVESLKSQERLSKHNKKEQRKQRIENNLDSLTETQVRAIGTCRVLSP